MISTSISSTSDYYSASDLDFDDDDDDVVKAAPLHHHSPQQTNNILHTLLHHHHHSPSPVSSTIQLQLSHRLLKFVRENGLSDEIFIRANAILHQYLLSTSTSDADESILIACLSLSTKLSEHSTHFSILLFSESSSLLMSENVVCNRVDWNIDVMTPINYVEAMLLYVSDSSDRDRLRKLSYEMVVTCLTDVVCMNVSAVWMGVGCMLVACELLECGEIVGKRLLENDNDGLLEASLSCIGRVLRKTFRR